MLLERAHKELGWPPPALVIEPPGAGAKIYADFAQQKIGESLKQIRPSNRVRVGVLSYDPNSDGSEPPLALVCEFQKSATEAELDEAHRLAWNFSRTALLITLEPNRVIAWTCFQDPTKGSEERRVVEFPTSPTQFSAPSEQEKLHELLHWVGLVTGSLLKEKPSSFLTSGRADVLLLRNLREVRHKLLSDGLPQDYCHDLLARIIFTQFLFHRRDTDGNPFFSQSLLGRLHADGVVRSTHSDLASILASKRDTYSLFRWLDDRFNGDLFPGTEGQSPNEKEGAWKAEFNAVTTNHLRLLRDLVAGDVDASSQQYSLWPHYSFDIIPLEFISSIYEEFLNEERQADKAYYTPSYLVDYILDTVLPWDSDEWDIRVLDPSCGSGIFLVKAFQRLIHRWRQAHNRAPLVSDLKPILSNNLFGVDKNPEAVRVASFSLFLAMADAIEPKHYVTREHAFPKLRGRHLIAKDFFHDDIPGFRSNEDAGVYDLVVGNAPWGDGSASATSVEAIPLKTSGGRQKRLSLAETWANSFSCPIANRDIGPLFLAKAAQLVRDNGLVAMIQPASTLLLQRAPRARDLRRHLFTRYSFIEVTNLGALRRSLFNGVIGPACIVTLRKSTPKGTDTIVYVTPKAGLGSLSEGIAVEPQDVNHLTHDEAASVSFVWSVLALGGRRDLQLVSRLSKLPTLGTLEAQGKIMSKLGVIPGDEKKKFPVFQDLPYLYEKNFPGNTFLELDARELPTLRDPRVASTYATNPEAFKTPQLLVKLSPSGENGRFRAATVRTKSRWGVVCKKTYLTVHDFSPDGRNIQAACLAFNSLFASYFLRLTGSRTLYNTEMLTEELKELPIPFSRRQVRDIASFEDLDSAIRDLLNLTDAEWSLVEDFHTVSLPGALRLRGSAGRHRTVREAIDGVWEPELTNYIETFAQVLKTTFGQDKRLRATVFCEPATRPLPLRLITLEIGSSSLEQVKIEPIASKALLDTLTKFHRDVLTHEQRSTSRSGLAFTRVAFLFHAGENGSHKLSIVKPDERRYWSTSIALRDADQLSMAILRAASNRSSPNRAN